MSTYRAYEVTGQGHFELVEKPLLEPQEGHVRFRVQSCGVCHSDALAVEGQRPNSDQPVVPGHEAVGVIDAVGANVAGWRVGDRVGVGFLGGPCGACTHCRRGDFVNCENQPWFGTSADGGYAEVAYARASGLVRIPDTLDSIAASPLLCAGITTYNALQLVHAAPDSLVAIQGIGGLGHLGIQYADKLGYRVAAIARGAGKAELATALGADHYIDSAVTDPAEALRQLGGASAIVATASSGASMGPLLAGLKPRGQLIVVGVSGDPIPVDTVDLVVGNRSIAGMNTGTTIENEDSMNFSAAHGVTAMTEVLPFDEAPQAYARMMSGEARFRVVLDMRSR